MNSEYYINTYMSSMVISKDPIKYKLPVYDRPIEQMSTFQYFAYFGI